MTKNSKQDSLTILLVEDDPGDVLLITESLAESKMSLNIQHVDSGADAMDYLRKRGKYSDAILPDLMLLDLNLPGQDGRSVLKKIKEDDFLMKIPVLILTTSEADTDIRKSYDYGANAYITKPMNLLEFSEFVATIENFWLTIVQLPPRVQ